jgi:hypothetical protein
MLDLEVSSLDAMNLLVVFNLVVDPYSLGDLEVALCSKVEVLYNLDGLVAVPYNLDDLEVVLCSMEVLILVVVVVDHLDHLNLDFLLAI